MIWNTWFYMEKIVKYRYLLACVKTTNQILTKHVFRVRNTFTSINFKIPKTYSYFGQNTHRLVFSVVIIINGFNYFDNVGFKNESINP